MNPLCCPRCHGAALADDEFCETSGDAVGRQRDAARHQVEIDVGRGGAISDVGHVRSRNEDAVHLAARGHRLVAVVCDGVSSSAGSQVAAEVAAATAGRALDAPCGDPLGQMADALHQAGERVAALPWSDERGGDPPSCTTVAALVDHGTITVGWAGDSRASWVTADGVLRLTQDHSWAQHQIEAGTMTTVEAMADGRAHAIPLARRRPAGRGTRRHLVHRGERAGLLVLCSDGLWNGIDTGFDTGPELITVVGHGGRRPIDVATSLVTAALARGGHDNVSVIVVAVDP